MSLADDLRRVEADFLRQGPNRSLTGSLSRVGTSAATKAVIAAAAHFDGVEDWRENALTLAIKRAEAGE